MNHTFVKVFSWTMLILNSIATVGVMFNDDPYSGVLVFIGGLIVAQCAIAIHYVNLASKTVR